MGRHLCVLGVLVTACGDGVFIEVSRPANVPGVERVELIIGQPCKDCGNDNIILAGQQFAGAIFEHEDIERFGIYGEGPGEDVVVFHLPNSGQRLGLVAAAGINNRDEVVAVAAATNIELVGPHRYAMELAPRVAQAFNGPHGRCLVLGPNNGVQRMLVPAEDHDCDGVPEPVDCEDLDADDTSSRDEMCADDGGAIANGCLATRSECRDTCPTADGAAAEAYCVVDAACECDTLNEDTCITTTVQRKVVFDCQLGKNPDGTGCARQQLSFAPLPLPPPCGELLLAPIDDPFAPGRADIAFGDMTLQFFRGLGPCMHEVAVTGAVTDTNVIVQQSTAAGTSITRVANARLTFAGDCNADAVCIVSAVQTQSCASLFVRP